MLREVAFEDALELMLASDDLTWTVYDGVLIITSEDRLAAHWRLTRVYPVADLVELGALADRTGRPLASQPGDCGGDRGEDYDTLINLITSTIDPTSWENVGGDGAIEPIHSARALAINQSYRIQRKIERLLANLRQTQRFQGIVPAGASRPWSMRRPTHRQPRRIVYESSDAWRIPRLHD